MLIVTILIRVHPNAMEVISLLAVPIHHVRVWIQEKIDQF